MVPPPRLGKPWSLETVDLEGLAWYYEKAAPPAGAVGACRRAIEREEPAWWIANHGVDGLEAVKGAGTRFFDRQSAEKKAFAVGAMDRSRGWELYPHHRRYHERFDEEVVAGEQSTREGIIAERFVMGPPDICEGGDSLDPYFSSAWGRVFFERNAWPNDDLREAMTKAYGKMYAASVATVRVLCAALGAPHDALDDLVITRHHSRLQLNHYPTVHFPRGRSPPTRANAHYDTSVVTLLAREPTDDENRRGGLEIRDGDVWRPVPAGGGGGGVLTVQLGSLVEYLTNGRLRGATHRVSLPAASHNRRRLSCAFVLKPDYMAPAAPPPSLAPFVPSSSSSSDHHPVIGLVGRVGWQNHAILAGRHSSSDARAAFKLWKLEMRARRGFPKNVFFSKRSDDDPDLIN